MTSEYFRFPLPTLVHPLRAQAALALVHGRKGQSFFFSGEEDSGGLCVLLPPSCLSQTWWSEGQPQLQNDNSCPAVGSSGSRFFYLKPAGLFLFQEPHRCRTVPLRRREDSPRLLGRSRKFQLGRFRNPFPKRVALIACVLFSKPIKGHSSQLK